MADVSSGSGATSYYPLCLEEAAVVLLTVWVVGVAGVDGLGLNHGPTEDHGQGWAIVIALDGDYLLPDVSTTSSNNAPER